jgi:uncharacterized phage-associated protein
MTMLLSGSAVGASREPGPKLSDPRASILREREGDEMSTVHDTAAYILGKHGPMTAMKLQKLIYYAHAWSLVWDERPLFSETIQAWANGPIVYELFDTYRGQFQINEAREGNPSALTTDEQKTVDAVLRAYGGLSARKLSFLTHGEDPWRDARGDLPDTARSDKIITNGAIAQYYSTLDMAKDATDVNDIDWDAWLNADDESVGDAEG